MIEITINLPEDVEQKSKMTRAQLAMLASRLVREKIEELVKIERFSKSVAKSKLTEKDVEEISDKINTAMWEYHKKKYNL